MKLRQISFKIISMVMVFTMLFGMSATTISAVAEGMDLNFFTLRSESGVSTKDPLVYVSIGDSMTNGYGLEGYDGESGIMNYGKDVYSNQFAAWLAGYTGEIADDQTMFTGTNGTVDHRQLAMSGLRAEDLAWLLNLNCTSDDYAKMLVRFKNDPWSFKWDGKKYSGFEHEWGGGREYWYSHDVTNPTEVINGYGFTSGDWRTWTDLLDPDYRLADGAAKILSMYGTNGFVSDSVSVTQNMITTAQNKLNSNKYYPDNGLTDSRDLFGAEGRWLRFVTEFYQDSVADADIITLALGNTNFGTFMFDTIKDIFFNPTAKNWFPSRYHIDEVYLMAEAVGVSDELMNMIEELIEDELNPILEEQFGDLADEPLPETVVDGSKTDPYGLLESYTKGALIKYIIKYCVLSYIVSYIDALDRIVELNPDVELVQIALMNAYKTENGADDESGVDFADIIDKIYAPMNAFISMLPGYLASKNAEKYENATFYFAETGTVETLSAVFGNDFYTYNGEDITYDEYQTMLANGDLDVTKLGHKDSTIRERFHHWLASSQGCRHSRKGGSEKNTYGAHIYCSDCYLSIEMTHKPTSGGWGWCDVTEYGEMWKGLLGPIECPYPDDESAPSAADKSTWQNGNWEFNKFFGKYRLTYVTEADIIEYELLSAAEKNARLNSTETKAHKTAEGYSVTVGIADLAFSCAMYLAFEDATIRAGKNSFKVDDLTGVSGLGYDTFGGAVELFAEKMGVSSIVNEVPAAGIDAYTLTKNFSDALVEDGPSATMLCLANRMQIGTGIGGHPSKGGHDTMAKAIKGAYDAGETGSEVPKEFMLSYLTEKYPDVLVKLGAISELTKSDDLNKIVTMLKMSQKSGNSALAGVDLDALEADIRDAHKKFEASKTPAQVAAAQEDIKELMNLVWTLAAKSTGNKYEANANSYYVSLGDSNVNGYGLDGYIYGTNGGHGQKVPGAAPVMLAKALYGENWENKFGQFAMGSLRSEDLLYLLGGENVVVDDYYTDEVSWRVLNNYASLEDAQAAYEAAIKKADLISISIGGGNVSTFTGEQVDRVVAGEKLVEMDWAKIGFEPETMAQLDAMLDEMVPLVDMFGLMNKYLPDNMNPGAAGTAEFARVLLESMLYGYASYNYYYPQVLARIREINPDAQLLILGMFNPIDEWSVPMNGKTLPIGGIVNNVMDGANMQNLVYALQNLNTTFVDVSETETILDAYVKAGEAEYTFDTYYQSILVGDGMEAHASADGHKYMLNQMLVALSGNDYNEELKKLAENLYDVLNDNYLTTEQKVELLEKLYSEIKNNSSLEENREVAVVESIYRTLSENGLIRDEQTLAVVLYVYTVLADGVNDADYLDIIAFVYRTVVKNEAPARAARSVALSDEAKAVLTLKIVLSVVAENYLNAENQEVIETLITGEGALINDQLLLALADNLVNLIEEEATSQAELLEKAVKTTVEIVANDPNTDASIKLQIAEVLTKAAENNGWLGGVEENPEMSKLLVVKKLYNRLTEAGLLTEAQVNNIIDYLYPILTSGEALDKDQVAEVVTYVYNVIFANGFELEAGIDMATIVCFTLMEEEIITMEDIKEILKGSYSYVLEYYDDAYAYAYEYYRDYIVDIQNEIGSVRAELMNVIALIQKSDIECAELEGLKEELIGELHLLNVTLGSISELLGNDNLTEDFESIMEELKRLEALAVQHYERLTTIVEIILPVAKEKGEAYLAETLTALQTYVEEYITTKVNDAINSLYVSVKEQVLSYLADKADMLYNKLYTYVTELVKHYASTKEGQIILAWLDTHKEVLFDLYEEYGDELMAYLEEYGEIVVELLNDMVEEYGDDVLDAISAYIDEIMPTIVSWIEMHEAYAKDLIKAYIATIVHSFDALKHPELGLPAHPDFSKLTESYDKIFGLSMELLDLMNSGDFDYDNATALVQELKAEIMGLKSIVEELLKNTALDINAVLQQNIENIQAEIKAQIERLEEAKKTADEELQQAIQDQINALDKELANLLEISASYGEDALAQLDKYLQEKVEYYLELAINELVKFVEDAVRGEIAPEDNSNFVSVNGGNALYADLLKAYIEGRYPGEHSYKVMLEKMTWDNLNYDALADADLITLGFDENELSGFAVEQLLGYVSTYIQTTLKDSALKYSEETIDSVASYMAELLTYSIAGKEPTTLVKPSHVEQFKTIATEIVNGFVNGLVGEGEIPTSVQIGDNVFDLNLGEHAATLEIVGTILADNEVVELDWAGLIGEKYVHHIDLAMDALRNKLLENGISETATYAIPLDEYFASTIEPKVRELIYDAIQMVNVNEFTKPVYDDLMNLYGTLDFTGLVKDFTIEIPVLDAIMCAAESYLYRNVEFQIEYGKLIYNLYETNPEATLILIGHYNPYDMAFTLGDVSVDLTEAYSYVAGIASVQPFVYALLSEKVLYVDIYDAETNYDAAVNAGLPHSLESFLKMYLMDLNPTDLSEAGNKYVADKIQNLLTVGCDNHKYSSPCDEDCDRCGATRLVPGHQYDDCEDEYCNLCNEHRVAPGHEYGEDGKCIHCGHVRPVDPDYPVVRPDPTPLDPQCIAGTHFFDDCDDTTCHKCNYERTAPGHKFDCETGKCANCDKAIEPTGHVYLYACSETCELCGKANPNKVMHSGNNCRDTACKYCGTTIMATKHNYTSWTIIEATRENNGYEYRSCKLCGLYEVKVIRAFGTLSGGAIAGIVIGSVVVAGAAGFAIYWFLIQKKTFEALLETIKALVAKLSTPAAPVAEAAAPAPEAEAEAPATEEETK